MVKNNIAMFLVNFLAVANHFVCVNVQNVTSNKHVVTT